MDKIVSLKSALCGFKQTVVGIDGKVLELDIKDVLMPGQDRRIPGEGMPNKYGKRGDLIFKFSISFPSHLSY